MERVIRLKNKTAFVLLGIIWGGLTALLMTLLDPYINHRPDSAKMIAVNFVLFMLMGIPYGLYLWKQAQTPPRKVSRRIAIWRQVLFLL